MEITRIKSVALATIIFSCIVTLTAQDQWELKKEEQGVKAYVRDYPGIKFKEYLVETTVDADIASVIAAFTDFSQYDRLYPETEDYTILEETESALISRLKINTPFPAKDRVGVFKNDFSYDITAMKVHVDISCLTDESYQTPKGLIRIPFCKGTWDFHEIEPGKVSIKHQFISDPGGFAPAFIVNAKTVNNPIITLNTIKDLLKDSKYRNIKSKYTLGLSGH